LLFDFWLEVMGVSSFLPGIANTVAELNKFGTVIASIALLCAPSAIVGVACSGSVDY